MPAGAFRRIAESAVPGSGANGSRTRKRGPGGRKARDKAGWPHACGTASRVGHQALCVLPCWLVPPGAGAVPAAAALGFYRVAALRIISSCGSACAGRPNLSAPPRPGASREARAPGGWNPHRRESFTCPVRPAFSGFARSFLSSVSQNSVHCARLFVSACFVAAVPSCRRLGRRSGHRTNIAMLVHSGKLLISPL